MKFLTDLKIPAFLLGGIFLLISAIAYAPAAQAQRFVPRVKSGPGRTQGGATRGTACEQGKQPLLPITSPEKVGLTTQAYPTLAWYLPAMSATEVEFVLQENANGRDRDIYRTIFQVTGEAKLITIKLPDNSNLPPLQVGKTYTWKFMLNCTAGSATDNFAVTQGQVQRIVPPTTLAQALQNVSPAQRAALFAKEGIWYDAASNFLESRRQADNSQSLANWQEFINSVPWGLDPAQLNQVIQAPIAAAPPVPATPISAPVKPVLAKPAGVKPN
jgi:Domain of Unknown Function (DUF928)